MPDRGNITSSSYFNQLNVLKENVLEYAVRNFGPGSTLDIALEKMMLFLHTKQGLKVEFFMLYSNFGQTGSTVSK